MGIDAKILVRIKGRENWLPESEELPTAVALASTIGASSFLIGTDDNTGKLSWGHHALSITRPSDEYDEYYPDTKGKVAYYQDADPIIADEDEQFLQVHLVTRYYDKGYARGDWPTIRAVIEWLWWRFPKGDVWYGGDSSGVEAVLMTVESVDELNRFYLESGRSTYLAGFGTYKSVTAPVCPACNINPISTGGGGGDSFWSCQGCGQQFVTIGKTGEHHVFSRYKDIFKADDEAKKK